MAAKEHHTTEEGFIVCGHYRLVHKICSGNFGTVFLGTDLRNKSEVAVKMETKTMNKQRLLQEYQIYKKLKHEIGFPEALCFDDHSDFDVLVMELLGPSLEDLFNFCCHIFTLKTVLLLADQLLSRLQTLHLRGLVHRDIKPDNFAMGLGIKHDIVYLIDMGLCKKYSKLKDPDVNPQRFCGTVRFASPYAHRGFVLNRRDDLISLAYTLIYFLKGDLPWSKFKYHPKEQYVELTGNLKNKMTVEELCSDCPEEFKSFLQYCYQLNFDEAPDYKLLRRTLWTLFDKKHFIYDNVFDWDLYRYAGQLER